MWYDLCAPDLRAKCRHRDSSDLKDERPGVGVPTPSRCGAGWDRAHHTPGALRRIWGFPLYSWGKVLMSGVRIQRDLDDARRLLPTIVA